MRQIPLDRSNKLPDDDGVAVYLSRKDLEEDLIPCLHRAAAEGCGSDLLDQFEEILFKEMMTETKHVEKSDSNPHDYDVRFRSGRPAVPPSTPEEDNRPATDNSGPPSPDALSGGST